MGAPMGNRNAAGSHKGNRTKKSKLRRNKNLFKIKTKIPKGFKKTQWHNVYIG